MVAVVMVSLSWRRLWNWWSWALATAARPTAKASLLQAGMVVDEVVWNAGCMEGTGFKVGEHGRRE